MTGDPAPTASPSRPPQVLPDAPGWFRRALAVPFADEWTEVDGARIHFLAWGERGRRGIVFVHGGGAHAHWWTHVAALFADDFRVVALDLSGHGDSDHRASYSLDQWTEEVLAAAEAGGIAGPPVVVGHSMGGFVTIATAALHADRLAGAIVCDSPVSAPDAEVSAAQVGSAFGAPRTYPTLERGARAVPHRAAAGALPRLRDRPRRPAVGRPVEGGWQWKFDRGVFAQFADAGSIRASRPALPARRSAAGWRCCGPRTAS